MASEAAPRSGHIPFFVYLNFAILLPTSLFQNGLWRLALIAAFMLYLAILIGSWRANQAWAAWQAKVGLAGRLVLFETIPAAVFITSLTSPNKVRILEAAVILILIAALLWRDWRSERFQGEQGRGAPWLGWVLLGLALCVPLLNLASGLLVPKLSDVATTTIDAVSTRADNASGGLNIAMPRSRFGGVASGQRDPFGASLCR